MLEPRMRTRSASCASAGAANAERTKTKTNNNGETTARDMARTPLCELRARMGAACDAAVTRRASLR
ncbi:hypothetical protein [Lysobacter gummosus]|uniref:hypothetical protein n=1 Tax=Lysobacter gummosus TaxID=262324 RepID=UPI003628F59F